MNTIESNNRVIAAFMGATFFKDGSYDEYPKELQGEVWGNQIDKFLKYHESWAWLMPVVETISKFKYEDGDTAYPRTFGMPADDGLLMVRFNRQILFYAETLLQATYLAVIDFIKWNATLKTQTS